MDPVISSQHFGDPLKEYDSVCNEVGALNLCNMGRLRVSGRDRTRFLHNMLSNDIKKLGPGSGCPALLLSRQGHVEAELCVYNHEDEFWLEAPPACSRRLLETLNRFIVGDVVTVDDLSERFGILSLQGPRAAAILMHTLGTKLEELPRFHHRTYGRPTGRWTVICRDRCGLGGYDVWLPLEDLENLWESWIGRENIQPVGFQALNVLRTEAGIPWYGSDFDDSILPMEAGLEGSISMTKGCYRGQEIVARISHRGHLDRGLGGIGIESVEIPQGRAQVFHAGVRIGRVTSAVVSPLLNQVLALAILKKDLLTPGTRVDVACDAGKYHGQIVALPLRRHSNESS